jgi:serine/threonine protein kinase
MLAAEFLNRTLPAYHQARRTRHGAVYRAIDTKLNREVAIKVLPPALAGDHARMARFEREAHLLASLSHIAFPRREIHQSRN